MATKGLLADLSEAVRRQLSLSVRFDAAGGVEVARNIRAGADADLAVLSSDAMAGLDADGLFEAGTLTPVFTSDVVAAVPEHSPEVRLSTEHELKAALIDAERIAYSTGPSGKAILDLIERLDLADVLAAKLIQAPPGTPVGTLLAAGGADLGFQQRSELSDLAGVRILGALPGRTAIRSTFSGAVLARSANAGSARAVLSFLASRDAEEHVRAAGMFPA